MDLKPTEYIVPTNWVPMNKKEKFRIVKIHKNSEEYKEVIDKFSELIEDITDYCFCYDTTLRGLFKVQNPAIYTKFRLKAHEYEARGEYETMELFHDTARRNRKLIAKFNFDWRRGERRLYGPGVYFSISPLLANRHSSRNNGILRTLFLAEVLIQKIQIVQDENENEIFLPDQGYDTVLGHSEQTYVKYLDNEFYPKYFIDYLSF